MSINFTKYPGPSRRSLKGGRGGGSKKKKEEDSSDSNIYDLSKRMRYSKYYNAGYVPAKIRIYRPY